MTLKLTSQGHYFYIMCRTAWQQFT